MSPLKYLLVATLLVSAALPATSYALACRVDGSGSVADTAPLGTALAVAADAPDGTIIWESGPRSVNVICKDDFEHGREEVFFYLNPASVSIGKGIRAGIRYNSVPITQSSGKYGTGFYSDRGCNLSNCVGWDKARFTLNFSVFIEKFGSTPQNGQASTLSQYRVFQLDGITGAQQPAQQQPQLHRHRRERHPLCALHARPDDYPQCRQLSQTLAPGKGR